MGDFAIPIFPFAKPVRSAPLKIAEAIRGAIGTVEGIAELTVAPPGYLNVKADRTWLASALASDKRPSFPPASGKILVEHTSINPNKAAHIGHLRNAMLGDTFVRILRYAGSEVDVQNYIDNTGVQVADVVVGFHPYREEIREQRSRPSPASRVSIITAGTSTPAFRSGTKRTRQNQEARCRPCTASKTAATETAAIADLISIAVFAAILRRWIVSTSNTTSCLAKAKSCTCISGTLPSQVEEKRRALPSKPKARTKAAG